MFRGVLVVDLDTARYAPPLCFLDENVWVPPHVLRPRRNTRSSCITEFFEVGLSRISTESGTPTIYVASLKTGGSPLMCSDPMQHGAVVVIDINENNLRQSISDSAAQRRYTNDGYPHH